MAFSCHEDNECRFFFVPITAFNYLQMQKMNDLAHISNKVRLRNDYAHRLMLMRSEQC